MPGLMQLVEEISERLLDVGASVVSIDQSADLIRELVDGFEIEESMGLRRLNKAIEGIKGDVKALEEALGG